MGFLWVFIGGGIGSVCRYAVSLLTMRMGYVSFPFGTLAVNIVGAFLMGFVASYFALHNHLPQTVRLFLTTGFMGGFTTFSAFSLEVVLLYQRGQMMSAVAYVAASLILGLAALVLGMSAVRWTAGV